MGNSNANENNKDSGKSGKPTVEGEGSYSGTRDYDKATGDFIAKNKDKIPGLAKDAEDALEGPEGAELREAEDKGKSKARH